MEYVKKVFMILLLVYKYHLTCTKYIPRQCIVWFGIHNVINFLEPTKYCITQITSVAEYDNKSSTDEVVHSIFWQICYECDETETIEYLTCSWMYDIIKYWAHDKKHPYCNDVKKTVFDVTMRTVV